LGCLYFSTRSKRYLSAPSKTTSRAALVARTDRAAQQINVTQLGVTVDEIAKARAIVAELMGDAPTLDSQALLAEVSPTE
jgi:hypothetical protein